MSNIFSKMKNSKSFSSSEQEVVKYILANPQRTVNMSIRSIAQETYTSPSTVMRTCRKICSGGFAEFRIELAKEIIKFDSISEKDDQNVVLSKKMENTDQVMNELRLCIEKSIECTQMLMNAEILENVIQVINKAKTIDIYGRGSSNSVGKDFCYKMYRLGYNVHLFEGIDLQAIQAFNSDNTHCAIIISSTGETPEIINFSKILNGNGTPIITITGSQDCTLLQYSDYPLFFKCFETNKSVGGITSRSAMQYVLDIIYFCILNGDYDYYSNKILKTYVPESIGMK